MTLPPIEYRETLALPLSSIENAADALERAHTALAQAENLTWVSSAANAYRAELHMLATRLRRAELSVAHARERWHKARLTALRWGQL